MGSFVTADSRDIAINVCVSPLSHISPLGLLFVLKMLPHTQQAMKVKTLVAFSLVAKIKRSLPWMAIHMIGHFS